MKLAARDLPGWLARPAAVRAGLLIFGADPMRVALRRAEAVSALIGPQGEAELRLTRLPAAQLRRDGAELGDAVKAIGFFPGPRVVLVEEAGEALAPAAAAALSDWSAGDAVLVVTAGALGRGSALRKLFEGHPAAAALALYDDPPGRAEIEAELRRAGLPAPAPDGMAALLALAREIEPGDLRQVVEKLALYLLDQPRPAGAAEVAAVAPATLEADLDRAVAVVAERRTREIGPMLGRLQAQGVTPVSLCLTATRHFRTLLAVAADPGGPASGVGKLRPPAFGPRREALERQARDWGRPRLEQALALLIDTDLTLRSTSRAPAMPLVERALIRISELGRR